VKTIKFNDFLAENYEKDHEKATKHDFYKALLVIVAFSVFGADIIRIISNIFVGFENPFQ
jgi:hypothetical protein